MPGDKNTARVIFRPRSARANVEVYSSEDKSVSASSALAFNGAY